MLPTTLFMTGLRFAAITTRPRADVGSGGHNGGPMEREVLLTGIGGQGVQLASKTLAFAAVAEGREVMLFGSYGGAMRGGNTDSTVIVGDCPLLSPPTVTAAWYALGMHHAYWPDVAERLRPRGVAVIDSSVFRGDPEITGRVVILIEASKAASDMGAPRAASMVALGALAAATGLVGADALVAAASEVLPSYRADHARTNADALRLGMSMIAEPVVDAWAPAPVSLITSG